VNPYLAQRMGCRRLSYDRTLETPLRVVKDEPEKVVFIAYRIELNNETCAERSRSKVLQGWLLPDHFGICHIELAEMLSAAPAMQFSNSHLGIAGNSINCVDRDSKFAITAALAIKRAFVAKKAAKIAGATEKRTKSTS